MTGSRRRAGALGRMPAVASAACLAVVPLQASGKCRLDDPAPIALCSVGGMLETANPAHTLEGFGNLNPRAFAGGANADLLPGQANLSISGGVTAGGAACARHLAAKRIGGTEGVPGLDQGTVDFIEQMSGETLDVPTAGGGVRRAVFDVFSPNISSFEGSSLGKPLSYKHSGTGGWPRNSGAHLTIALTEAGPGDLRAGGSYHARAVGGGGDGDPSTVFSSWTGEIRPRPYLPPKTEKERREQEFAKRMCRTVRANWLNMMDQVGVEPLEAGVGRDVTELDCDMDGVAQAGTRTRVPTGQLTGMVHIEQITDTKVIGRFELSGTARVERERRTWNPRARNHVLIDSEKGEKPLRVTGRFAAPNMRNMGYAIPTLEIAQAPSDGKAPAADLQLVAHRPARDEKNLPWDDPGLRLRFDRPVDPASVTAAAVKLETGLADGQGGAVMAPVHVRTRLANAETVAVTPQEPLRDGVRYRVTVQGGPDGIRGAAGEHMAVDRVWGFDTMVDLDDTEFMQAGLARHLDWREGVESDTIQVATNAPLVRDKPAAIRVYPKWRADPQIAPGWQVTAFEAHVRARPAFDPEAPLLVPERREVRLRRPDMFTDEERRKGENSVTLFGWTPEYEEIAALRAEIEPVRDCEEATKVFSGVESLDWSPIEKDLKIGYIFAKIGPWRDGVPPDMFAEGVRAAQAAERFTLQQFPVQNVTYESLGTVEFPSDLYDRVASAFPTVEAEDIPDMFAGDDNMLCPEESRTEKHLRLANIILGETRSEARGILLKAAHDALAGAGVSPDYDATVVFMPLSWIGLLGKAEPPEIPTDGSAPEYLYRMIAVSLTKPGSGKPAIHELGVVTHELGHTYGLRHIPKAYDDARTPSEKCRIRLSTTNKRMPGIEGMRLSGGGDSAMNKSYRDGNEEHPRELVPLMHPRARPKIRQFISRANYLDLIETFELLGLSP